MNINDISEIKVSFSDGQEVIYRGKGLEKFRRLISDSPPYGSVKIVEEDSGEEVPDVKQKPKKEKSANGYVKTDLSYGPVKGKSAMDSAREMQKQAELTGIKF